MTMPGRVFCVYLFTIRIVYVYSVSSVYTVNCETCPETSISTDSERSQNRASTNKRGAGPGYHMLP